MMYFDYPTQVLFHLEADEKPDRSAGIAYRDEIICCCCGAVNKVEDCDEILPLSWVNIQEAVKGVSE